jgi:hypothetical protein
MSANAVYPPSGSSGELQFVNSSGLLDASQCIWDSVNSKLTVSGTIEVLGTQTIIDTQHLQVEDAIIGLGTGSAGEGAAGDRGLIFLISGETNPALYWDESADEFRLARLTNTPGDSALDDPTTVDNGGYQNLKLGTISAVSGGMFDTSQRTLSSIGSNVFFYVDGSDSNRAVFGGDVVISGTLYGGSPLKIGGGIEVTGSTSFTSGMSGSLTHLVDGSSYLRAGTDITILSSSDGHISVTSNASDQRDKFVYDVTASHAAQSHLDIPSLNFSSVSFDPKRIDVFVNGQLMTSGSSKDYVLPGAGSLSFYFELLSGDIISIRTY